MSERRTPDAAPTTYYGGTGQPADKPSGSGADQAKEKATEVAGQAKEQASQAVDTAKEKAGQVAEQATAKADVGLDKAAGGLDKAADVLRERGEAMGGQGSAVQSITATAATRLDGAAQYLQDKDTDQLKADLEAMVRQKPTQTLLVAAGVGFLLSKIVR